MKTIQFKTDINCSGCIKAITPHLSGNEQVEKWEVDLMSPDKILSIETSLDEKTLSQIIQKAGFKASPIHRIN